MKQMMVNLKFKIESLIAIGIIIWKSYPEYKKMIKETYNNYILERNRITEKMGSILMGVNEVEEIRNGL